MWSNFTAMSSKCHRTSLVLVYRGFRLLLVMVNMWWNSSKVVVKLSTKMSTKCPQLSSEQCHCTPNHFLFVYQGLPLSPKTSRHASTITCCPSCRQDSRPSCWPFVGGDHADHLCHVTSHYQADHCPQWHSSDPWPGRPIGRQWWLVTGLLKLCSGSAQAMLTTCSGLPVTWLRALLVGTDCLPHTWLFVLWPGEGDRWAEGTSCQMGPGLVSPPSWSTYVILSAIVGPSPRDIGQAR